MISGGIGDLAGGKLSRTVGRITLGIGLSALALGILILALAVLGWGPLGTWSAGLAAVILFALAGLALPFSVGASLGQRRAG